MTSVVASETDNDFRWYGRWCREIFKLVEDVVVATEEVSGNSKLGRGGTYGLYSNRKHG